MSSVTLFCYWGGKTCVGQDGVSYDKPPSKAIKDDRGIRFVELLDRLYHATSIDKQQQIKVTCRYPSVGIGKVIRYVLLPINDNDDIDIMFEVLIIHQEISSFDLYLEVEDIAPIRHIWTTSRNHEPEQLTNMSNAISDMIQNDDFYTISQVAVVNNAMDVENEVDLNPVLEEGLEDEKDEVGNTQEHVDGDETPREVPSTFTSMEGTNFISDENWNMTQSMSMNDFTRELGKEFFKDKEELITAIKLHSIGTHRQFQVINTRPTIWTIRCKLYLQSGCKWKERMLTFVEFVGKKVTLEEDVLVIKINLDFLFFFLL